MDAVFHGTHQSMRRELRSIGMIRGVRNKPACGFIGGPRRLQKADIQAPA